jgi:acyl carrier protein
MITRPQILSLILNRLRILGEELNKPNLTKSNEQTRLFGDKADLDSMGLVTLIADLEDDLQKQLGRPVTLVDEKAMSRLTSPFRRVDYLADYLVELLNTPQS